MAYATLESLYFWLIVLPFYMYTYFFWLAMFDNLLTNGKAYIVIAPWGTPADVVLSQMKFYINVHYFLPVIL